MEKYNVIVKNNKEYNYYKNIPYIPKKDFNETFFKFVGETKLKDADREGEYEGIIKYENDEYIINDSTFGFEKGYIQVEEHSFVILKTIKPIIIWLLIGLLALGVLFGIIVNINQKKVDLVKPVIEEIEKTKPDPEEKKVIYKLSFNANGGTGEMDSIDVKEGESITLPKSKFKKKGFHFIGWSLAPFGRAVYKDQDVLENLKSDAKEVTLFAIYSIDRFKVLFLNYDGSVYKEQEQNYNSDVIFPEDPIRLGYTFNRWDNDIKKITKNTTYKALFDINTYNLTYALNGGKISFLPSTFTIESGNIAVGNPTKRGYTFIGWSVNGSTKYITDFMLRTGSYGDKNLVAKFTPNLYKISFDVNGGNSPVDDKEVYFDSKYGELPIPERTGYTFTGWINSDGEGVNEETVYEIDDDITLQATWEANDYIVTFNPNEGMVTPTSKQVTYDSTYGELPEPIREGYNFKGWFTDNSFTTEVKTDTTVKTASNHELVAKWKKINYVIEYNTVGGILEANVTIYDVEDEDFTLPYPTKEGYTFIGWTGDNGTTPQKDVVIPSGTTGNYKYQANWQVNYYTVNYYVNNSLWTTRSVAYGSAVPNLTYSVNDKQKFSGWSGYISTMPAHNVNITGIVRETNCGVQTGHGNYDRISAFVGVFNNAGFNAYIIPSNGAYAVSSNQNYAYSTAVNMLNYVWTNTSPSGSHALNYIQLTCDNGHVFEQWRS